MKRCSKCGELKSLTEFHKNQSKKDGLQHCCKMCRATRQRAQLEQVKPNARKYANHLKKQRVANGVIERLCTCCLIWKLRSEFGKNKRAGDGLQRWCKNCSKVYQKNRQETIKGYLHMCFAGMVRRCTNPKHQSYDYYYGGRGIEIKCTFDELFHYIVIDLGFDTVDKIKNLQIDRINTNGNYEISNLRIVTRSQNQMNARKDRSWCGKPCSSQYKGVSWYKRSKKWLVQIVADGIHHRVGYFSSDQEQQAAEAYDVAALKYHKDFACTNRMLGLLN